MCKRFLFILIIKYKYEQQPVGSLVALTLKKASVRSIVFFLSRYSLSGKLMIALDLVPGDPRGTAGSF